MMTPPYKVGQLVQYMLPDRRSKAHWFNGTIHGIRRYENQKTNLITKITYLVDTGRDERIDEYLLDPETGESGTVRQPEQLELPAESLRLSKK